MRSRERSHPLTRGALALGPACAALALAACSSGAASRGAGAADPGFWVDSSTPPAARTAPSPRRDERWDLADQLRRLGPASARAHSEHQGGELEGEVLASPGSGYPLRGPASVAPAGATLVERLFAPGGTAPASYFVMIKHPPGYDPSGDWEYMVVAPDGRIEARSPLPLCVRCHAEAPHDHLFGGGR